MDKRWYPVAFSFSILGCGGDVDEGKPTATGGLPQYYYGMMITGGSTSVGTTLSSGGGQALYGMLMTGGRTQIDSGVPTSTGGMTPIPPYGVMPVGGAPVAAGGTSSKASGGKSSIDTGTPAQMGGQVATDYGVLPYTGGARSSDTSSKKPTGSGGLPVIYGPGSP